MAISILMYHQVGHFAPMQAHRANYCHVRRFAAQMELLARLRYQVLDLDQAVACLTGRRLIPARAVVLTFDDGYANFADSALPILNGYGYPATVYAIAGWLGRPMTWAGNEPNRPTPPLMSADQLRRVRTGRISVGAHSMRHVKLGELAPQIQQRELEDSKAALEDILGEPVRHLCYPFGSFNQDTVHAAADAGYASATTCLRGGATREDHPLALPRKAISYGDNLLGFWWKLAMKDAPTPELVMWRRRLAADRAQRGRRSAADSDLDGGR